MSHTPEPWRTSVYRGRTKIVRVTGDYETSIATTDNSSLNLNFCNSDRIVACVNACAGIANPAAIPDVIEACRTLLECRTGDGLLDPASNLFRQAKEALERLEKSN